ncbi:MAG: ABC transporter permease [Candidatus Dormibacteria bacterium]|jgi:D-xylose transport system permease protein
MTLTQGQLEPGTSGATVADVDLTAAAGAVDVPPEILAQSLGEYFRGWWQKLKGGDSGLLPVLVAMVIVAVVFELITPENAFLRPSNLVYIFELSTVYMVLSMGEIVVLLLGELDLSIGAVALMGGVIAYKLVQTPGPNFPWWAAILASLVCCGVIGGLQGILVARVKIPAFVVTLGGFLLFSGMIVIILGGADTSLGLDPTNPNQSVLYNLEQGNINVVVSWVGMAVVVVAFGAMMWLRAASRRRSGLVAPPASLAAIRIALMAAAAVAVLAICTVNRGGLFATIQGLPWVIPVVLGILGFWTVLLQGTRYGRYVYAIGGNPEAARRAGVSLPGIRTWSFVLCSATAGFAGILLGSFYYGQYSSNVGDPGQLVLYSVAAAVIGGTSLFGGRGKPIHGVLGGLLIGAIAYGVSLLQLGSLSIPLEYILPGAVLLLAVLVDVVSRRGARTGSVARV